MIDLVYYFVFTLHMASVFDENSFQSYIIHGAKGRGKSTYAIKAVAQLYHILHKLKFKEVFREALKCIAFTAFVVIKLIEEGRNIII